MLVLVWCQSGVLYTRWNVQLVPMSAGSALCRYVIGNFILQLHSYIVPVSNRLRQACIRLSAPTPATEPESKRTICHFLCVDNEEESQGEHDDHSTSHDVGTRPIWAILFSPKSRSTKMDFSLSTIVRTSLCCRIAASSLEEKLIEDSLRNRRGES
ncbi:uncharacterized protein LAESUDRAFT_69303 [Laetiporus sulphureus 93-53]|uniref:Uncharacterized protein n=1 Tax=Laetiporus sulphureus 93-53 TaxID=1314785 RepID=A0A165F6Y3_9APHY|nr:uncharacterized protein LAESUDRAFT_69303 [Laetiporus sulphureus 93-53]KZT08506.1 hypothetical protein LAESUDRAFT_69303 [Laetiporus sulphureus 93-53]